MTHENDEIEFFHSDEIDTERERRLGLIPFDWQELPRVDWPHGNKRVHSFEGWAIPNGDGRKLLVEAVHQELIYAGALTGGLFEPTEYLLQAIKRAEKLYPQEASTPIILPPKLFAGTRAWTSNGVAEREDWLSLPRVRCIALLFNGKPARDENEVFSSAVVIWFQDHFGMPDSEVQKQLADLEWQAFAVDWTP
jgi:hypothetical protein